MKWNRVVIVAALGAAMLAAAVPVNAGPAEPFARPKAVIDVSLSPAGDRLAVTRRVNGRVVLTIVQLADMKLMGSFGITDTRDIWDLYWVTNDRLVFGLARHLGLDEATALTGDMFAVNADGSDAKLLIGRASNDDSLRVMAVTWRDWDFIDVVKDEPDNILISRYDDSDTPYLVKLNVKTGKQRRLGQARVHDGWFQTDNDYKVRLQGGTERDGTHVIYYRPQENSDWQEFGRYNISGKGGMSVVGFAADNLSLYVRDNRETSTAGIYLIGPNGAKPQLLFDDAVYDVSGLLASRTKGVPLGVRWRGEHAEWKYFDPQNPDAVLFESIRQAFPGKDVSIANFNLNRSRVVIRVSSDVDPGTFYVIDLDTKKALAKFPIEDWIVPAEMSPMKPFTIKAGDGLELHGYVTIPQLQDRKKMVVMPHGGPIGVRDVWQFDPEVQWLAKNGFTVLQVNYRGSGGYGGEFQGAGNREWGGKMIDDVADATRWAIAQGYADPSSICIFGASYGGYSALMSAVRYPSLYKCAVGYAGVYDLPALKVDSDASWRASSRSFWDATMGEDNDVLRRESPALRASEIKIPVMLIHGGEDRRAPKSQYFAMKDALTALKHPPVTLYKENEAHGFSNPANNEELLVKLVEFLDANSGGTTVH